MEQGYTVLIHVGDIDRSAEDPTSDRRALFEQRKGMIGAALAGLGIMNHDAALLDCVLGMGKGVRLLARLLPNLAVDQVSRGVQGWRGFVRAYILEKRNFYFLMKDIDICLPKLNLCECRSLLCCRLS